MRQPKICHVTFRDTEGVEHTAEVAAESLYEAGALRVEVCESTFYTVKVAALEAWLKRAGGSPREVTMRQAIKKKLG